MTQSAERLAYVNGEMLPESRAKISIYDAAVGYGDAVFDTMRTFNGVMFRFEEHLDRLFDSLRYARIDPGMSRAELKAATERLVETNRAVLREGEDYWVSIKISSGVSGLDGEPVERRATVIILCQPLPLRARASYFRDGIDLQLSPRRRTAPSALSPNVKTTNYIGMMIAQREIDALKPGAWAILADERGDLAEGVGCNLFVVKNGEVITPPVDYVLAGVSREVVLEICRDLGLPHREAPVSLHLGETADEAFLTSTSLCACPARSLNGVAYPGGAPGPVTARIMAAFAERVGMDYVAQYKRFQTNSGPNTGV